MQPTRLTAFLLLLTTSLAHADPTTVTSPNHDLALTLSLQAGTPAYSLSYKDKPLLPPAPLGLTFQHQGPLKNLELTSSKSSSHDETYPIIAGKTSTARDHYNQATLLLTERDAPHRQVQLSLRAYDDGVAFRYTLPTQPNLTDFPLTSEDTTFNLPKDATAWVLPLPKPAGHYEYYYHPQKVADIKPSQLVGLPLLLELPNGPALAITEANLNDYPGMCLAVPATGDHNILRSFLTPRLDQKDIAVKASTPHDTPWRIIQVADTPGKLIESTIVSNCSDPSVLTDTSWIHPGKVAFLWWNGFLVGKNGKRGALDTATQLHYVDAAAEFGFPYCSVDGLDLAWYGDKLPGDGSHDITTAVPALDMDKVLAHAKEKGVRIRLWLPSVAVRKQLDKALPVYEQWGIEGLMIDFVERDDQETTNWMRDVLAKCAARHLTVSFHNIPKPTGLSRTYPNLLTYEAVLNQEYDKWSAGATATHNVTVPFTRMLAGPLDYHAGGFRSVRPADFLPHDVGPEVPTTRCQQLAMYVVYEDPLPMAADYPAAYRNRPGIDFLSTVPTTWDQTLFLQGHPGDYITLARRKGNDWYIGSMTNDKARDLTIPLSFLPKGTYTAESWSDDQPNGPNALTHQTTTVSNTTTLTPHLAPTGGQVIHLTPKP